MTVLKFETKNVALKSMTDVATFIGNTERDDYRVSALFYVVTGNLDVIKSSVTKKIISATKQKQVFGTKLFPLLTIRSDKDNKNGYKFDKLGSKGTAELLIERGATDIFNLLGIDKDIEANHEAIKHGKQITNAYYPRFVELLEDFLSSEQDKEKAEREAKKDKKDAQLEAFKAKSPELATADESTVKAAFGKVVSKINAYQQLVNTLGKHEDDLETTDLAIIADINELLADLENKISTESRTPVSGDGENGVQIVNQNN